MAFITRPSSQRFTPPTAGRQRQPFAHVLRDAEEELAYVLGAVEQGFGVVAVAMDTATQQHTALYVGKGAVEPSAAPDPSCLSRFE